MPTLKDQAVVLRLVDWSETSQIAVLLTREHGKISAVAKGAKRQTPSIASRFSGGLELLCRGEAVYITKSGRDLANLIEWDLRDGHWSIRRDLQAFDLAMYAVDLTHHMLHDDDPHPTTFAALVDVLAALDGGGPKPPLRSGLAWGQALLRFQWAVIDDCGYRPMLDEPDRAESSTLLFSASSGGLVSGAKDQWKVRQTTVALLRRLSMDEATDDEPAEVVQRANRLLCAYCRAILDKQLPTMAAILTPPRGRSAG
jgi:DNA repair protein RecO (recombination protein O)